MKVLIAVFALLCPATLFAQTDNHATIELSAVLQDTADQAVAFATITNLSYHKGVVSNEDGYFMIQFDKTDTLEISAVGYEKQQLYFGDTATVDHYDLAITLKEKTYELDNVTVFAYKDEYAFKKALLALDESDLPKESPKIKVPGSYYGPKVEKRPGIVQNPVSFIYDRLSGRAKEERKAYEVAQAYEHQKTLAKKYNKDLVGEITGLKDDKLEEFMSYCRLEDAFIEGSNDYEVIMAINHCYEEYRNTQQ